MQKLRLHQGLFRFSLWSRGGKYVLSLFINCLASAPQAHREWVEVFPRQAQYLCDKVGKPMRLWVEPPAIRLRGARFDPALPLAGEQITCCSQETAALQPNKT